MAIPFDSIQYAPLPGNERWSYSGRNGVGHCIGIEVYRSSRATSPSCSIPYVSLYPRNSKGAIGSGCFIEIPESEVGKLCIALQSDLLGKVLDTMQAAKQLPALIGLDPVLDAEIEHRLRT